MTIKDVASFFVIFVILLSYTGMAMSMLQLNTSQAEEDKIVYDVSGFFLLDSFVNEYLLSLGEFSMDAFKNYTNVFWCYTLFITATLLAQVVFLNMLIALMGSTFDELIDKKPTLSPKNKLSIMGTSAS